MHEIKNLKLSIIKKNSNKLNCALIIVYYLENNLVTCFNDDGMEDILNGHFLFIFSNNKVEIHPKGTGNFLKLCLEVVNMALAIPRFMLFWAFKGIYTILIVLVNVTCRKRYYEFVLSFWYYNQRSEGVEISDTST